MRGTAGMTLLLLGCVKASLGAVGGRVVADVPVEGMVTLFSIVAVDGGGRGAGVILALGCLDPDLLSTGSSEVGCSVAGPGPRDCCCGACGGG